MANEYKLDEADLDLSQDLEFVDQVLRANNAEAEPAVRRYILDLTYTLARNQLVEARRFANLTNKRCIDESDLQIAKIEATDDFKLGPGQLTKHIVQPLTVPSATNSLILPPWRHCQVGVTAELKQPTQAEAETDKSENPDAPPPKKQPRLRIDTNPTNPT
ncbi:uncharacterized protein LOC108604653 [Drosophila busckii]|uniref:uncharacterized protein LOC108604653 n=1 Tax=Drosophila busckii TaxID=30019 RepID=UPI00083EF896|nr:uncharacterized protein LOC108604653 [Drosophila busckii]